MVKGMTPKSVVFDEAKFLESEPVVDYMADAPPPRPYSEALSAEQRKLVAGGTQG